MAAKHSIFNGYLPQSVQYRLFMYKMQSLSLKGTYRILLYSYVQCSPAYLRLFIRSFMYSQIFEYMKFEDGSLIPKCL